MARDPHRPFLTATPDGAAAHTRQPTTAQLVEANRGPGLATIAFRTLLGILAVLLVLSLLFLVATAIEGDDAIPPAPWAEQSAPSVTPGTLDVQ